MQTIDNKEFGQFLARYLEAVTDEDNRETRANLIAHIDAQLAASRAAGWKEAADFIESTWSNLADIDYSIRVTIAESVRDRATQAAPTPAPTDLREAFDNAFLSWNGSHTQAELDGEWARGSLAGEMFREGAKAAAAPLVSEQDERALRLIKELNRIAMSLAADLVNGADCTFQGHDYLDRNAVVDRVMQWRAEWDATAPIHAELVAGARAALKGTPAAQGSGVQADPATWLDRDGRMIDALRDLIEGMSVSMDVSTGDHDAGNRYFGRISEVMDDDGDKNGVTLLVYDAQPNFAASPAPSAAPMTPPLVYPYDKASQVAQTAVPVELYTCKGKGGEYEWIGTAYPAGFVRQFFSDPVEVYRSTTDHGLYFRECGDFNKRMEPIAAPVAPSQTDPLDTPLPCDIKVGAVTIRKGCALRTLVVRMESLQRMAMKAFPEPSAEGRALIDSMIAGTWKPDEGGQASAQSEGSQA